jgi:hypothetical protein
MEITCAQGALAVRLFRHMLSDYEQRESLRGGSEFLGRDVRHAFTFQIRCWEGYRLTRVLRQVIILLNTPLPTSSATPTTLAGVLLAGMETVMDMTSQKFALAVLVSYW